MITIDIDRDFDAQPITAAEAISLFKFEQFELALATPAVIEEAARNAEAEGFFHIASDIGSRYDDYQEELRCMAAEFT